MDDLPETSLADALFCKTRKALIGALFSSPDKAWHLRELARHAGVSPTMLAKETSSLSSVGIVKEGTDGQRRMIQANRDCPIFDELAGIARKAIGRKAKPETMAPKHARTAGRKSEQIGLSAPYDWSNSSIDDDVLIARVLDLHDFRDVARVCANYGLDRVREVMKDRVGNPTALATLTRMLRNIENGMVRVRSTRERVHA